MKTARKTTAINREKKKAFTLIEVLIAMFVFGLAMAGVLAVLLATVRSVSASSEIADVNGRLRLAQERLLLDLRSIESITELPAKETATVDGNSIEVRREFSANIYPRSAHVEDSPYSVTYRFDGDAIVRVDSMNPTVSTKVLSGISDAWFEFYNRKGTTDKNTTDIRSEVTAIRVTFVPKQTRLTRLPASCSALVQLRNPTFK